MDPGLMRDKNLHNFMIFWTTLGPDGLLFGDLGGVKKFSWDLPMFP